ncbi:hypothetical protein [Nitrososphaeria virus YSH_922147]|uniref:Uncharacterized protein n=1 Tax=Nitrososphaeria virus YSH_922147 TaxID=3071323 RepID=A0A976YF71_9CAUD|nr:hypothetical protein QKV94_gp15 [Yangshan Harbor Nitrososphaeria virus]UVF62424.1 hypothetical protein [Nitrososphaeria virus YSH_922147]
MTDPQSSLDRLLKLKDEILVAKFKRIRDGTISLVGLEKEYHSLKKEIQGLIEKGESLINAHDDVFELGERKYWDIKKFGSFFKVETRMEYDKLHCEKIINLIIHAFQMNLDSELEQQNKALTEQVKTSSKNYQELMETYSKKVEEAHKLKEQVKQLQEELAKYQLKCNHSCDCTDCQLRCLKCESERIQNKYKSERDQLKSKIEKMTEFIENEVYYELDNTLLKEKTYPEWKEILGENDKK